MGINSFLPGGQSSTNIPDFTKIGNISGGGLSNSLLSLFSSKPQYLVKTDGGELAFQSMLEMSVEESTTLPTEPIEKGSFANYNRVVEPITVTCRLGVQGYPSTLQSMLDQLTALKNGTEKCSFITPMASYENLMLESYDYRRDNHNGHNVLIVDLRLKEIREIEGQKTTSSVTEPEPPPVAASSTADGSCASSVDGGEVQTYTPSSAESEVASTPARKSTARKIAEYLGG